MGTLMVGLKGLGGQGDQREGSFINRREVPPPIRSKRVPRVGAMLWDLL